MSFPVAGAYKNYDVCHQSSMHLFFIRFILVQSLHVKQRSHCDVKKFSILKFPMLAYVWRSTRGVGALHVASHMRQHGKFENFGVKRLTKRVFLENFWENFRELFRSSQVVWMMFFHIFDVFEPGWKVDPLYTVLIVRECFSLVDRK